MNSKNSKTSDLHRLLFNLADVASSNLSMYQTWKNIKMSSANNKFKVPTPTWNEKFELPDGSYSLYQILKIILNIYLKNIDKKTVKMSKKL